MSLRVLSILALSLLVGCASTPPVHIPHLSEIDRVEINPGNHVIEGEVEISLLLEFIQNHNSRWEQTAFTFPTPQCTVAFRSEQQWLLVLWVGPKWIGIRDEGEDATQNRLQSISDDALQELYSLLELPNSTCEA